MGRGCARDRGEMSVERMGGVDSKPRDLRNDRGYRVVVVLAWVGVNLNTYL